MSSVAGAVVTIDGDSSGLVSALQKGEKGIDDVRQSADKLSDQLREVADDADKADRGCKVTCRKGNIDCGTAENIIRFSERCFDIIDRNGSDH